MCPNSWTTLPFRNKRSQSTLDNSFRSLFTPSNHCATRKHSALQFSIWCNIRNRLESVRPSTAGESAFSATPAGVTATASSRAAPRVINRWSKIEIESHHLVKSEFNREMSSIRPVSFFVTGRTVYSFVLSECLVNAGVFLHCTPWRWVMQRGRNFGRSGRSFWKLSHVVQFLLELNKFKYQTTFRYKIGW